MKKNVFIIVLILSAFIGFFQQASAQVARESHANIRCYVTNLYPRLFNFTISEVHPFNLINPKVIIIEDWIQAAWQDPIWGSWLYPQELHTFEVTYISRFNLKFEIKENGKYCQQTIYTGGNYEIRVSIDKQGQPSMTKTYIN